MEADAQVLQLEQALIRQAESLAREQRERAESGRARILNEASEKIRLAEEREVMAAKVDAEKVVRRHTQAAETRLAAELDRLRWALTEASLSGVKLAFQDLVADDEGYLAVLEHWLTAAVQALPKGDLVAEVRGSDQPRVEPVWAEMVARVAPGRKVVLATHGQISEGGIRVRLADNRAQLDQTFEARQSRMADELARVAMERLFASTPDLGSLVHG
jgi:V/A-type H+/Na+-transporting ATPase subunit E